MTITTSEFSQPSRHAVLTRVLQGGLALAIVALLGSSQFMDPDGAGNTAFAVHQYAGLSAFALVLGLWLFTVIRKRGTPVAELLPWLSSKHRKALWDDVKTHVTALRQFKLPSHEGSSPMASAIHALGLLLMTAMAVSGTVYYFINAGDPDAGGLVGVMMLIHTSLANLVWAYLIGHAGFAVVNHFGNAMSLRTMWTLKN